MPSSRVRVDWLVSQVVGVNGSGAAGWVGGFGGGGLQHKAPLPGQAAGLKASGAGGAASGRLGAVGGQPGGQVGRALEVEQGVG